MATISILLPILRDLSYSLGLNPMYLMIPATLSCSYAFMLPVATPPNAIVYAASGMNTMVMVRLLNVFPISCQYFETLTIRIHFKIKCGFFMNVFCIATNWISINTYGDVIYQVKSLPDWALPPIS